MKGRQKLFAIFLYALPIIFFIVNYFLLTTSGEDIFQGANNFRAGTPVNPIGDAIDAFNFNSRITDMYAWSVIDFFDYQFRFGPDLIFRLIDLVAISTTFYLLTYLALDHKPRLTIKDALIFCALFAVVIITPFGRTFYIEFSMIHNYIPLALATLLFSIPYFKLATGHPPTNHLGFLATGMLFLGLYFGMAATITPLAFLATVIFYCLAKHQTLHKPPLWFFAGILGTIIGFSICWFAGSGVDHYTNPITAATFDYLPLSNLFTTSGVRQLIFHEFYNFGITITPLLVIALCCLLFVDNRRQFFTISFYRHLPSSTKTKILLSLVFLVIHVLGASLIKAPPRLLIPAHLAGVLIISLIFAPFIKSKICAVTVVIFTTIILILHTVFLCQYHHTATTILEEIRLTNTASLCIDKSRTLPPRIPIVDLGEANILVDWGYPEIIHGKAVTFCE